MAQYEERKVPPFRFDIVGSFLRPEALKKARTAYASGTLDAAALRDIEDREIAALVARQKEVGLHVITDGEFRRSWWHLDFFWGLGGIEKVAIAQGYVFNGEETRAESARVTGRISGKNHPFVEHFKFLKQFETSGYVARQTIPAPAQLWAELQRPENQVAIKHFYASDEEARKAIAAAYRTVILDLYAAGCRNVQLDDCTWGMLVDARYQEALGKLAPPAHEGCSCHPGSKAPIAGGLLDVIARDYYELNNASIVDLPEDLVVTTHVCRGNYHSTWASSGGYDAIAHHLFAHENVEAFYLEFDTERSGGFAPLAQVAPGKKVVLGVFSSKTGELEDKEQIKERVKEASAYVPLENLAISPQCGFASTEEGNILSEEQQWAKLALIRETAREIWG